MNKVLFDTNIVLDYLLKRKSKSTDDHKNVLEVINYCILNNLEIYTSILSIKDVIYIITKLSKGNRGKNKRDMIRQKVVNYLKLSRLVVTSENAFHKSLHSDLPDFEDALQLFTAIENKIDIIITRNKKDFTNTKIGIFTPEEFLKIH
ncbi:MAG: PIN domain-containing protein [Bacteroidales bacterium]|nr:PIN domain-containing protein [Bacteroidales bacterium]